MKFFFSSQGNKLGNVNCQLGFRKQTALLHSVHIARKLKGAKRYMKQQSLSNPPTAHKHHVHLRNISGFQIN